MDPERPLRRQVKLEDIMRPAVSVAPETSGRAVLKILVENKIPGVPVVDAEGYLKGFISDGHLLAAALPKYMARMKDLSFVGEGTDSWVRYLAESADRPVSEMMSAEVSQVERSRSEATIARCRTRKRATRSVRVSRPWDGGASAMGAPPGGTIHTMTREDG